MFFNFFSWGTKGDNTTPMDLGVASKVVAGEKGEQVVEVELKNGIESIDRHYDEALDSLLMKPEAIREVYFTWGFLFLSKVKIFLTFFIRVKYIE